MVVYRLVEVVGPDHFHDQVDVAGRHVRRQVVDLRGQVRGFVAGYGCVVAEQLLAGATVSGGPKL